MLQPPPRHAFKESFLVSAVRGKWGMWLRLVGFFDFRNWLVLTLRVRARMFQKGWVCGRQILHSVFRSMIYY